MITWTDKVWMAGFVDGEGYIGIIKRKYQPCISIGNTKREALEIFASNYGGDIRIHIPPKDSRSHLTCYYWRCPTDNLLGMLLDLHPYLVIKKPQCEILVHLLQGRVCHKPLWPEDVAFRERLYLEANKLNRRSGDGSRVLQR